jgi:septum formation protein
MQKNIILASGSSIRNTMLLNAGIEFEVIKPLCDENAVKQQLKNLPTKQLALELAKAKAQSVSEQNPNVYVIGSDQICECEGQIISKSYDEQSAYVSLKFLSGKTHYQINGTCIYYNNQLVMEKTSQAELIMRNLSDDEILDYIELDNPIGCAGSYKYEENGKMLFEEISGADETILGFDLSAVLEFLKKV